MEKPQILPSGLLIIILVLFIFVFVLTLVLENTFIRTIMGLPMVLFIPGYILIAALFPKKNDLNAIERIALSNEISADRSREDKILTGILVFSVALAIGMLFFTVITPKTGERFTEFYILDPSGEADNYSTNLKSNFSSEILVGVTNHEYTSVNYTVRIALDKDVLSDTWLRLNNNETWEKKISFVPNKEGNDMKLEFWLFKENNFTAPYRELHLWVNVTK